MMLLRLKQFLGLRPLIRIDHYQDIEYHGSSYGGWFILANSLDSNSLIYSVGIGEDITFDLSLIDKYKCNIYAFDPTPKAKKFIMNEPRTNSDIFYNDIGLASKNGKVRFYHPAKSTHSSFSIRPASKKNLESNNYSEFNVKTLKSILVEKGHKYLDLLKLDIEGFEYEVINTIIADKLDIRQLVIEFHHNKYGYSNADTLNSIRVLREYGYRVFCVSPSGNEVSMIKE